MIAFIISGLGFLLIMGQKKNWHDTSILLENSIIFTFYIYRKRHFNSLRSPSSFPPSSQPSPLSWLSPHQRLTFAATFRRRGRVVFLDRSRSNKNQIFFQHLVQQFHYDKNLFHFNILFNNEWEKVVRKRMEKILTSCFKQKLFLNKK